MGYESAELTEVLTKNRGSIMSDTLADDLVAQVFSEGYTKTWNINGTDVKIGVVKAM